MMMVETDEFAIAAEKVSATAETLILAGINSRLAWHIAFVCHYRLGSFLELKVDEELRQAFPDYGTFTKVFHLDLYDGDDTVIGQKRYEYTAFVQFGGLEFPSYG